MSGYAVVFFAWGERYVAEVERCVANSPPLHAYDIYLITDRESVVHDERIQPIRGTFTDTGLVRKTEMVPFLPEGYDVYLFLDSDTVVIEDISLGFEAAERHGIAAAPAPHYSLDYFWTFGGIMREEGAPLKGQLQYNTGVIFFRNDPMVWRVFERWRDLVNRHKHILPNDQPYFTLAMEQLGFNPYTLSISYNYRARGDAISGVVRVWHAHEAMPEDINVFDEPWPPRKAVPGRVIRPSEDDEAG